MPEDNIQIHACTLCGYFSTCELSIRAHMRLMHAHEDLDILFGVTSKCVQCIYDSLAPYVFKVNDKGQYIRVALVGDTEMLLA